MNIEGETQYPKTVKCFRNCLFLMPRHRRKSKFFKFYNIEHRVQLNQEVLFATKTFDQNRVTRLGDFLKGLGPKFPFNDRQNIS